MLIPENKKRAYPSMSADYDEVTKQIIAEAWIKFASASTISFGPHVPFSRIVNLADDLTEEFKNRFIIS